MAAPEPLSDILEDLAAWCEFDLPSDRRASPIGTRTLRAVTLLHKTDPAALASIRDRYVDAALAAKLHPSEEDQSLFVEEVKQAYREATSQELESRSYGLPVASGSSLPNVSALTILDPGPSLYPNLPPAPQTSGSTARFSSVDPSSSAAPPASTEPSDSRSATNDAPVRPMYQRLGLGSFFRTPLDRFRSSGRPRQSVSGESTSGSYNATYSSATGSSLPFASPRQPTTMPAPAPFRAEALLTPMTGGANALIDAIPREAVGIRWELRRIALERPQALEAIPLLSQVVDAAAIAESDQPHAETLRRCSAVAGLMAVDPTVWIELDREHASRREGRLRHLGGCTVPNPAVAPQDWISGRVRFIVTASLDAGSKAFTCRLEPLRLDRQTVEARRRFGSSAFLELQALDVKGATQRELLAELVRHPKTLLGDVWRALVVDGERVHFVRTNEGASEEPSELDDLESFLDWSGPFSENRHQTMAKRISRLRLLFSTTIPVRPETPWSIEREPDGLGVPDETSKLLDPANPICMTDGNGLMGLGVAQEIRKAMQLPHVPSVVQARICGSKGTWTIDLSDGPNAPTPTSVVIRQSQLKIRHHLKLDPSFCIMHINKPARLRMPGNLSWQVMAVLLSRGVPTQTFCDIVDAEANAVMGELLAWEPLPDESPANVRRRLILAIQRRGVIMERIAREQRLAEQLGSDVDDSCKDASQNDGTVVGPVSWDDSNAHSGQPISLYQKAIAKLSAGFSPQNDPLLAAEVYYIFKLAMNQRLETFHFTCPRSAIAFIVPDPCHVLKEGEVFCSFSEGFVDDESGMYVDRIIGDVCVFRHPCTLPTDIRKVKAVDCPQLNHLKDVVVFSAVGERPLASMLGGGDYDGDRVTIIWNTTVVDSFANADMRFLEPPFKKEDVFDLDTETVAQFTQALPQNGQTRQDAIQKRLVQPVTDQEFHRYYSDYHTRASYVLGLEHPETIRLAHITALGLDAPKLGLRLKGHIEREDRKRWGEAFALPPFHPRSRRTDQEVGYNRKPLKRDAALGPHPLDLLHSHVKSRVAECLGKVEAQRKAVKDACSADPELDAPWRSFREGATDEAAERQDVISIEAFVSEIFHDYISAIPIMKAARRARSSEEAANARAAALEPVLRKFHAGPGVKSRTLLRHPDLLARLTASCAYALHGHHGHAYPFDMAHADLCAIKKAASDGFRPGVAIDNAVAAAMLIDKRMVKMPTTEQLALISVGQQDQPPS